MCRVILRRIDSGPFAPRECGSTGESSLSAHRRRSDLEPLSARVRTESRVQSLKRTSRTLRGTMETHEDACRPFSSSFARAASQEGRHELARPEKSPQRAGVCLRVFTTDAEEAELRAAQGGSRAPDQRQRGQRLHSGRRPHACRSTRWCSCAAVASRICPACATTSFAGRSMRRASRAATAVVPSTERSAQVVERRGPQPWPRNEMTETSNRECRRNLGDGKNEDAETSRSTEAPNAARSEARGSCRRAASSTS